MFIQRVNGTSSDRVNRASSACVACSDGSPLVYSLKDIKDPLLNEHREYYMVKLN